MPQVSYLLALLLLVKVDSTVMKDEFLILNKFIKRILAKFNELYILANWRYVLLYMQYISHAKLL